MTLLYNPTGEYETWAFPYTPVGLVFNPDAEVVSAALGPTASYIQKVWDDVEGDWVLWETESMDPNGGHYPGPGTWGLDTSYYRVLNIKFTRTQG